MCTGLCCAWKHAHSCGAVFLLQITHLFKDVLHGNGRFVMVVNVSPAAEEFNETKRVLQVGRACAGVTAAWGRLCTSRTSELAACILQAQSGHLIH
jgi:hypothetical protein